VIFKQDRVGGRARVTIYEERDNTVKDMYITTSNEASKQQLESNDNC